MTPASLVPRSSGRLAAMLTLCGTGCTFLLPVLFFYSRALSDVAATLIGCLFLLYSAVQKDWHWTRKDWLRPAALFCALCLISSVYVGLREAWVQALCLPRLFLLAAALESWILVSATRRKMLATILFVLAFWLIGQCWKQYLTGTNLLGYPPADDGALTGPFMKPRAGFTLLMLFFPALMPVVLHAFHTRRLSAWAGGAVLLVLSVTTMVLIGQRMSNVLLLFGLMLTALMVRRFRVPFVLIMVVVGGLIASLPVISPRTYAKLVLKFSSQLHHFTQSDYGRLYRTAVTMVVSHPWLGLGMDGFRNFCHVPFHTEALTPFGLPPLDSDTGKGCNIHPHNYYLQIATTAGLPGLAAFGWMILCWLRTGLRALAPATHPQQAMLFIMCCVLLWPVASTSALFSFPTAGWIFLFAGWMLAASAQSRATACGSTTHPVCKKI
ncbi:O-antigen ligase family protein [Acetobacter persici]|uniref:O-antigen ligase family protein n=1 Tax=Acetobacter persici TaxID=1076596 RepID=UPI002010E918|nr:O-antigen ligase family protein [Acetobacter persici]